MGKSFGKGVKIVKNSFISYSYARTNQTECQVGFPVIQDLIICKRAFTGANPEDDVIEHFAGILRLISIVERFMSEKIVFGWLTLYAPTVKEIHILSAQVFFKNDIYHRRYVMIF
jgi:hypothetical protein